MARMGGQNKRQKSEVGVTVSLATRALNIVLQHWMIPDMGWKIYSCERHIEKLHQDIGLSGKENTLEKEQYSKKLSDANTDFIVDLLPRHQVRLFFNTILLVVPIPN